MSLISTVDAAVEARFGGEDSITYTPDGGAAVPGIKGIFLSPDTEVDTGRVQIQSIAPVVIVRTTEIDPDTVTKGIGNDTFEILQTHLINAVTYTIKQVERDEGSLVIYHLLEAI